MQIGRAEIFCYEREITEDNIIQVLQAAIPIHEANANRINFLLDYEAGTQPLKQKKVTRTEIDCKTVDNVAHEVSSFWRGYFWGQPITLVQRGQKDAGGGNKNESDGIALLNEGYEAEGVKSKTQKLGRFIEPCGVGYVYIDLKPDYQDGDSYFQYEVLDPRFAFVIRSGYYIDHRVMVGVSFRPDANGSRHYTAITKDRRFEIDELCVIRNGKVKTDKNGNAVKKWESTDRSGDPNPFGIINIVEYIRSHDRMGVFEHELDDMDDLNLNESNISNSLAETVNSIWWMNDAELPKSVDENGNVVKGKPKTGDWLETQTTRNGKTPIIQPLVNTINSDTPNYILNKRTLILQKCNVPQRNDNSGGSTGVAMSDATGWSAAEIAASMEQQIVESCKMEEVKVVLAVLKKSTDIPADSPLLKLRYSDILPNMKRSKQYEITTKINCYATGVSHGIDPAHMIREINLFSDPQQVIEDSRPYMERYLTSIYEGFNGSDSDTEDRLSQDESDQIGNSPLIDGPNRQQPEEIKEDG